MDALAPFLLLAIFLLPPVLVAMLKRTPLFWLPGAGLIVLGFVAFASMPDTHGDVGGISAMAAGVDALAGIGLIVYGVICLAVAASLYLKPSGGQRPNRSPLPAVEPSPAVELPPATVVSGAHRI